MYTCLSTIDLLESVSTACLSLVAGFAFPDADDRALHRKLAAEAAEVLGVLTNFNLLDLLPQTGAVARAVLADDSNLFGALRLQIE